MENDGTVFTLYLNSVTGFPSLLNNTSKSDVTWQINWDNFFDGEHLKWKKCRVRVQYITTASSTITADTGLGVLVGTFGSRYSNNQIRGFPLGLCQVVPSATAGDNQIVVDTLQTLGQNINIPYGSSPFNLALYGAGYGAGNNTSSTINSLDVPFQAIFQFELYDPIE